MEKIYLATITEEETEDYIVLYEKLEMLNILSRLSDVNLEKRKNKIEEDKIKILKMIKTWWEKIDDKYMLLHSDQGTIQLDTDHSVLFLYKNKI